jgi:hypothetical protein
MELGMAFRFGIGFLIVAALIAVLIVAAGIQHGAPSGDAVGSKIYAMLIFVPALWLFLTCGYACAVADGALDWTGRGGGARHSLAFMAATVIVVAIGICAAFHTEPPEVTPVLLRPLTGWCLFALPTLAVGGGILGLDGPWRTTLPLLVRTCPPIAAAGMALLILIGLLIGD